MAYSGLHVKHKTFGEGVVLKDSSTGIEVKFATKTTTIGNEFIDKVLVLRR